MFNVIACAIFLLQHAVAAPVEPRPGLALDGDAAEAFLREATVIKVQTFKERGVTRPRKVELTDGERTAFAMFKTIDESALRQRFADGHSELYYSDSYKHEIAAWELDKLLGLGIVPPAVERQIGHQTGALVMWIEGALTEGERRAEGGRDPPDREAWNRQIFTIRLFLMLIHDTDYQNINNLVITPEWKIYSIDASRAFRPFATILEPESLTRFSRRVLSALENLDRTVLEERLGRWLDRRQIEALWSRRELILEHASALAAERGEAAVFFD